MKSHEHERSAGPGWSPVMGMSAGLWTCIGPMDQPQPAWGPGDTSGLSLALQSWSTLAIGAAIEHFWPILGVLSGVPTGPFRLKIDGYAQDTWGVWIPPPGGCPWQLTCPSNPHPDHHPGLHRHFLVDLTYEEHPGQRGWIPKIRG